MYSAAAVKGDRGFTHVLWPVVQRFPILVDFAALVAVATHLVAPTAVQRVGCSVGVFAVHGWFNISTRLRRHATWP